VRQQCLVENLLQEFLVVPVAQLHLEAMLVWLERWQVLLRLGSRKLVTAVSTSISRVDCLYANLLQMTSPTRMTGR
jgi:hypothetical protein